MNQTNLQASKAVSTTEGSGRLWEMWELHEVNAHLQNLILVLNNYKINDPGAQEALQKQLEASRKSFDDAIKEHATNNEQWELKIKKMNQTHNDLKKEKEGAITNLKIELEQLKS